MKHPPYFLRPNKAIDRLLLIEAIRRLQKLFDLSDYTYYGFGGPYLEEFRLLYELCPEIEMVSIEENKDTHLRQEFHLPCKNLTLENSVFRSFLSEYESQNRKSIFWLDYTGLKYGAFEDFMALLGKVVVGSVIKVTIRAEWKDYSRNPEDFRSEFGKILPNPSDDPPRGGKKFACLLQDMFQISVQQILPSPMDVTYVPLLSFYYKDGPSMFTLTGIVCMKQEEHKIQPLFNDWCFANLKWKKPELIDVPFLSTKERLHLQSLLPCESSDVISLMKSLGYLIDQDRRRSMNKMKQYAKFHKYYPYFIKAIP